ncbi:MAG: GLUG motif-containing protein, partial [Planctomycetota bacterium]
MMEVRKSGILRTIPLLITIYSLSFSAQAKYGGGSGTAEDPYLIYTAEQMNTIGLHEEDWDKHFKLMADIDLRDYTGTDFNIIGDYRGWSDSKPFMGVFDGNGKRISNFNYTSTDRSYIGLFGYVDGFFAEIKDLGLIDPNVDAGTGGIVGSLAGSAEKGIITNCYVEGCTVSGSGAVGGLVGENGSVWDIFNSTTLTNCSSTGTVSGFQHVGGLVGDNEGGTIINCTSSASVGRTTLLGGVTPIGGLVGSSFGTIVDSYATGDVSGNDTAGGLVGENSGTITNCYATGNVLGSTKIGGLVGFLEYEATITNCYSTGRVLGHLHIGGLVGLNWGGTTTNSYWDIETSGQTTSEGGTGKTTAEMQKSTIFMEAGWDLAGQPDGPHDIWAIPIGGGYPILCWQISPPPALPKFSGGTGEPDDPYLISTAEELNSIGHNPKLMRSHFKLINDIDLGSIDFYIIGSELYPFGGVLNCYGKKISNFTFTSIEQDIVGLFGYVDGATIKNLGLINPNVDAGMGIAVGSLAGHLESGLIDTCYVKGGSVSGNEWVGGLTGSNQYATLTKCFTKDINISGTEDYIGGLIGGSVGRITQCYSSGCNVSGRAAIGGLVGANGGEIYDCYATDSLIGTRYQVGGLVGLQGYIYYGTIANCYATCNVLGFQYVGGLVGENEFGTITSSFWDTQTSRQPTSDGGTGKTTAQMQMASTFTDIGWDFLGEIENGIEDIWRIDEGQDYPRLNWQFVIYDFNDHEPALPPPEPPPLPPPPGPPPKWRGCFPADTPVWVNGALVQISNVVSGQMAGGLHCEAATDCLEQIETVEEHEGTFECRDIVLESGNRISV